jgi:hypothetical protein
MSDQVGTSIQDRMWRPVTGLWTQALPHLSRLEPTSRQDGWPGPLDRTVLPNGKTLELTGGDIRGGELETRMYQATLSDLSTQRRELFRVGDEVVLCSKDSVESIRAWWEGVGRPVGRMRVLGLSDRRLPWEGDCLITRWSTGRIELLRSTGGKLLMRVFTGHPIVAGWSYQAMKWQFIRDRLGDLLELFRERVEMDLGPSRLSLARGCMEDRPEPLVQVRKAWQDRNERRDLVEVQQVLRDWADRAQHD